MSHFGRSGDGSPSLVIISGLLTAETQRTTDYGLWASDPSSLPSPQMLSSIRQLTLSNWFGIICPTIEEHFS
jgi:hypothetical protein